jgi:hypothetical protein
MRAAGGIRVVATGTRVDRLGFWVCGLRNRQHRTAATAGVGEFPALQIRQRRAVFVGFIGLEMNISIPFESKILERVLELVREARKGPFAIQIVNPQLPAPGVVACAQVAAGGS